MQYQITKKLFYGTHLAFISPIHRLFSTSLPSAENPAIKSPFAVEYLVKSCGLSRDKAIDASRRVPSLKSPAKPDSVLQFLRQIGLGNADIRKAVAYEPKILCASLENAIKPRMKEIQELGFSPTQVAQLVSLNPNLFRCKNISRQRSIEFWASFLGSFEGILRALRSSPYLLDVSVEKVIEPNISFLEGHCGVSPNQMRMMIMRNPSFLTLNPNKLKEAARRAEKLGIPQSSGRFVYALQLAVTHSPCNLESKMNNLKKVGFSNEEIDSMIKKQPLVLSSSEERMHSIIGFLTTEAGFDLPSIALRPKLFTISLERRLIPRHYVLKSLKSKGLCQKWSFSSATEISEVRFEDLFVRPYRDIIPEVFEAYEAARSGKISLKGKI